MAWKFCPECGTKFEPVHKFCAECGGKRDAGDPAPPVDLKGAPAISELLRQFAEQAGKAEAPKMDRPWSWHAPEVVPMQQRCAFDGLPPGVYHLTCFCPKCSPRCGTSTYILNGDEQGTWTMTSS